jgi:chromate reductase
MSTFKIAGICGSLRKESYNKKLILRAQKLCAEHVKGATINIIDWSKLPVYNQVLNACLLFPCFKNTN